MAIVGRGVVEASGKRDGRNELSVEITEVSALSLDLRYRIPFVIILRREKATLFPLEFLNKAYYQSVYLNNSIAACLFLPWCSESVCIRRSSTRNGCPSSDFSPFRLHELYVLDQCMLMPHRLRSPLDGSCSRAYDQRFACAGPD